MKGMKTNVQETSTRAFLIDVLPTLGPRQKAVYDALEAHGPLTNLEMAYQLHWPINTVTPRCKELRDLGLVKEWGVRKCRQTGRMVIAWEAISLAGQMSFGV